MFDRFREARDKPGELNLIPIMNLMITLIPFLMLGAAFYHLGVIPTSLPDKVEAAAEPPKEAVVTLNLVIEAQRMILTASSAAVDQDTLDALRVELPATPQGHDLKALVAQLVQIKGRYPKSDTLVVLPDGQLKYAELVEILDATRERALPGSTPDVPNFEPLFPVSVFSERILGEADAGAGDAQPGAQPGGAP